MGYQALLFCPDEKLARVVSQVFGELDFAIELVLEPFAAVKKLMARRYDAIVVDCENEQNASLLFKSARNSSFNQTSLAIALVEGQAGVAKAYRIGANLVLTKPINVEQAKGTLRVARGLLRKNADAAGATSASVSTPAAAAAGSAPSGSAASGSAQSSTSTSPHPPAAATAPAPATSRPVPLPFETQLPAMPAAPPAVLPTMAASAKTEEQPAAPVPPPPITTAAEPSVSAPSLRSAPIANDRDRNDIVRYDAVKPQSAGFASALAPVQTPSSTFPAPTASAAAAAPAKEPPAAAPAHDTVAPAAASSPSVSASPVVASPVAASAVPASPASSTHDATPAAYVAPAAPTFGSVADAPSFGALDEEDSEGSGGRKKILIAVAAILVLALLAYFAFGKFGKSSAPTPSAQPVTVPQNSGQSTPAVLPMSAPAESPSTNGTGRASSSSQAPSSKTQSTSAAITIDKFAGGTSGGTSSASASRIAAGASNPADAGATRTEAAPMVVKSTSVAKSVSAAPKAQPPADDAAPALPAPVGGASASESNLNGLMSSASPTIPKAAFETLKVSQGVSQGLLIKRVQPKYPMAALAVHAGGAVQIEATINKEGSVVNPKVLKGDPILARAALDAVRQWRYKPYYLDGEPVEIQTEITINFKAN